MPGTAGVTSQLESELGHYQRFAFMTGARFGVPVPPVPSHQSSSHRSRFVSRAPSGVSVRESPRPPTAPSLVPPSIPEGEGESAP